MKWLSHGWSAFTGLVTLFIAFAVINHSYESFERIVVDLLVLTYLGVWGNGISSGFIAVEQAKTDRNRFLALMKAVGDTQYESEDYKEQALEDDETLRRGMIKGYIQSGFIFVIFVIAVLNLLGAL